jgi:hypothetical protein
MKLINVAKSLILEASAKDVLVNKLKLSEKAADFFVEKCGKLAIIMANKIIEAIAKNNQKIANQPTMEAMINLLNKDYRTFSESLVSIMDWIRVGLNGNLGSHKNDDYQTLVRESKKWHDELEVGSGIYNYEENEDNIILDFRDENGIGFYWVDLLTSSCNDEHKRMGHCASTRGDTLFSLRETRRINDKFTINKSHLTAAIEEQSEGFSILQLKGQKNSKPAEKYHKYIAELLISPTVDIVGFGSEYDSASDFKLSDLNNELFKLVMKNNEKLFGTIALYSAYKKGLIDEAPRVVFDIFIKPDEMYQYINSENYDSRRRLKNGGIEDVNFIENFLEEGLDYLDSGYSWKDFTYYASSELENKIEEYLINNFKNEINDLNLENDDDDYFQDLTLIEKIKELDVDELTNVISQSLDRAYEDAYYSEVHKSIDKALSDYGEVLRLNYEGALIRVNLLHFANDIDSNKVLSTVGEVQDELYNLVYEEEKITKPKLYINDNGIYIDDSVFADNFYELCSENDIPIKK